VVGESWRVDRNAVLSVEDEVRRVRVELGSRFMQVTAEELEVGVARMRADAAACGGVWVDPRPAVFMRASRL
jgi:hypothetical protein